MNIHTDIKQNDVDWMILRAGKVTASELDALVSPLGKIRTGAGPHTYLLQKLVERWTGGPLPQVQGVFDMEQGRILEEEAKPYFAVFTGIEIHDVAFISSDDGRIGCSPDAMISDSVGVEIKCPQIVNHVRYLLDGVLPADYVAQVQFSMHVTGADQWHFFSYRRRLPPLHLVIERDEKFQDSIEEALETFFDDLDKAYERLTKLNGGLPSRPSFSKPPVPAPEPEVFDVIP